MPANVTNHTKAPLSVGGVNINSGRTAYVERWDTLKDAPPVSDWLRLEMIEAEERKPPREPKPEGKGDEKAKA